MAVVHPRLRHQVASRDKGNTPVPHPQSFTYDTLFACRTRSGRLWQSAGISSAPLLAAGKVSSAHIPSCRRKEMNADFEGSSSI